MESLPSLAPTVHTALDAAFDADLRTHGYACVQVITPDEAAAYYARFQDWVRAVSPAVDFQDPAIFTRYDVWPDNTHGVFKSYGIGQAPFVWQLRCEPRVVATFAHIHGVPAAGLLTSFDGACLYPHPVAAHKYAWWAHADYPPTFDRTPLRCVQGLVNLVDNTGDADGGLVVWPNTLHTDWCARYPVEAARVKLNEWWRPPAQDPDIGPDQGRVLRAPAGTLMLWDSRLIHMNKPPTGASVHPRAVVYVCMTPKRHATPATLAKRRRYYQAHRTTSHWPEYIKVTTDSLLFRSRYTLDPKPIMAQLQTQPPYGVDDALVQSLVG